MRQLWIWIGEEEVDRDTLVFFALVLVAVPHPRTTLILGWREYLCDVHKILAQIIVILDENYWYIQFSKMDYG